MKSQQLSKTIIDVVEHAPKLKEASATVGAGTITTISGATASVSWVTLAGLGLTLFGAIVGAASVFVGVLAYREKKRENDLKSRELDILEASNGSNNNA